MGEFPNQHPLWPDKSHFEEFLTGPSGSPVPRCQSWKTDRSAQCGRSSTNGFSVCENHGAKGGKANRLIKSRRDFIAALTEQADESTQKSINEIAIGQLAAKVIGGDFNAIKYWFDQQFGGPTATVVTEIVDRDLLEKMIRVQAEFYKDNQPEFERWLAFFQQNLKESDSTSSQDSPEA
jgi:hypothetical protein